MIGATQPDYVKTPPRRESAVTTDSVSTGDACEPSSVDGGALEEEAVRDTAVLIPVYNAAHKLDRTLASLDSQDAAFDIVLVDDGSTPPLKVDQTRWRHRVVLISLPRNGGIAAALNAGLAYISAQGYAFVARHDAGDTDRPGRIETQRSYLGEHPHVAMVGAWAAFMDLQGVECFAFRPPAGGAAMRSFMHRKPAMLHPTVMMRMSALDVVGHYSEDYDSAEDYDLFFRLMNRFEIANIEQVLVDTEFDVRGISHRRRRQSLRSRARIQLREFEPGLLNSYFGLAWAVGLMLWPTGIVDAVKKVRNRLRLRAATMTASTVRRP